MSGPLVRVHVPVIAIEGHGSGTLREYRFRTIDDDVGEIVQTVLPDEPQRRTFREVALMLKALEAGRPLGKLPERFGRCVEVTVLDRLWSSGESSMLGAAAGFVAARATRPEGLPRLVATGALDFERGAASVGESVRVRAVAGIACKLATALAAPDLDEPAVVALPAETHPDDVGDSEAILLAMGSLRKRGHTVLKVHCLSEVLCAWVPREAWTAPVLAAEFAGLPADSRSITRLTGIMAVGVDAVLRTPWISTPLSAMIIVLGVTAILGVFGWALLPTIVPTSGAFQAAAERVMSDPDSYCAAEATRLEDSGSRQNQLTVAAVTACHAIAACDVAAGHPLDPDRAVAGRRGGISFDFLRQATRVSVAKAACEDAVRLAPRSLKARWHLSRALEAAGETSQAARLRQDAAARGEPMSRLRQAQDLLADGDPAAARVQLQLLSDREPPVPEALYTLSWLLRCGIGGPPDLQGSARLALRLRNLAGELSEEVDFAGQARDMAEAILASAAASRKPDWCEGVGR